MNPVSRKTLITILLLGFIVLSFQALASTPVIRNELSSGLATFKNTVERQAREFSDFFFISRPEVEENRIALTFDDGPDGEFTPAILDILAEKNIKATFFLLGENVACFPEVTLRIHREGHLIGNHSWSHPDFRNLEVEEIIDREIKPAAEAISKITGETPVLIRPPYGAIGDDAIKELGKQGYKVINWSVDTFDWDIKLNEPAEITQRVLKYAHPGDIILLHSGGGDRENTVEALPYLINSLQEKGFQFVTVEELLSDNGS